MTSQQRNLETVTYDPRNFFTDYFYETRTYSDLTSTNPTLVALGAPWNFDTLDGGFRNGLNNTSRPQPLTTMSQWSEDKNFNGRLDGFCTGDHQVPCTQGIPKSAGCVRCSLSHDRCAVQRHAGPHRSLGNEGTCFTRSEPATSPGEDRNVINHVRQVVEHAGRMRIANSLERPAAASARSHSRPCSVVDVRVAAKLPASASSTGSDDGDTVGDNNWWDLLLTPVLHKVNQTVVATETQSTGLRSPTGPGTCWSIPDRTLR